jgi:anti-anti-sigma regulatory factor
VFVLSAAEEVDHACLGELRAHLRHAVEAPGPDAETGPTSPAIVVDLRGTTFVSGAVLGVLARTRDRSGRRVRVVLGGRGVLRRALTAMGLEDELDVYDDLTDAVLADAPSED